MSPIYVRLNSDVHEQDHELVRPGAVFYLTMYRQFVRGTIAHGEELRFRRLPSWTKAQLERINRAADKVGNNIVARPLLP